MTEIDKETITGIEKEIEEKTNVQEQDLETKIQEEVDKRLQKIEDEKLTAEKEAKAKSEEEDKKAALDKQLADLDAKQKEIEKQLETISARKSIPVNKEEPEPPKNFKDLSDDERISLQQKWVESQIGMR